ncbi:DNA-binding transcriptional activator PunR [Shewanella sp. A32]|uniref:DNA-binding transcriptional activator PunR n=1 Tax=Shewanella sp. A32 TaxID=3031327 RepID=UPI0023B9E7A0|nr:DNA-binding transcriptional activator PunR [Shewanella sp. A32]MDF0535992.1 DNA-binding transcriptional activator PunR [Shewanella sp. A32]
MLSEQSLELIDLVAQLGSFTAAATHLNKVPSAVSYAIKQIEDEIGVVLFERHHRSVSLTPAGVHFVEESRELLKSIFRLKRRTLQVANGWQPSLAIALDCVVRADRVAYLIRDFYQRFDDVELKIRKENFNGVWEALVNGRCDVAIGATSTIPVGGPFLSKSMGKVVWSLVMSPAHPLAHISEPISDQVLLPYPAVCLSDTSWQFVPRSFAAAPNQRQIQVPDWVQAINVLRSGLGIGWVPRHLAKSFIESGSLIEKEMVSPLPASDCALLWNSRQQSPAQQWVLEYLGDGLQLRTHWID